jgi:hypothetical protein
MKKLIIIGGIYWLTLRWELKWKIKCLMSESNAVDAKYFLITTPDNEIELVKLENKNG